MRGRCPTTVVYAGTLNRASRARQNSRDVLVGQRGAGADDDERVRHLAPPLVGMADDGGLEDVGVFVEHALDLGGGDVLPAGDDHVLLAVLDVEEAVLVEPADVAGPEPAVDEGALRGLGVCQ